MIDVYKNYKTEIELNRETPEKSKLVIIDQPSDKRRKANRCVCWVDSISKSGRFVFGGYWESDYLFEIHENGSAVAIYNFGYIGRDKGDDIEEFLITSKYRNL